jgi:hypothetical protein
MPAQDCAAVLPFLFLVIELEISENRIRIQKYLENEIQVRKMQDKFWMNPQQ